MTSVIRRREERPPLGAISRIKVACVAEGARRRRADRNGPTVCRLSTTMAAAAWRTRCSRSDATRRWFCAADELRLQCSLLTVRVAKPRGLDEQCRPAPLRVWRRRRVNSLRRSPNARHHPWHRRATCRSAVPRCLAELLLASVPASCSRPPRTDLAMHGLWLSCWCQPAMGQCGRANRGTRPEWRDVLRGYAEQLEGQA